MVDLVEVSAGLGKLSGFGYTPSWKINGWKIQITHLEREMV